MEDLYADNLATAVSDEDKYSAIRRCSDISYVTFRGQWQQSMAGCWLRARTGVVVSAAAAAADGEAGGVQNGRGR